MKIEQKTAAERVLLARKESRPTTREYIEYLFDDFVELAGDRLHGEDASILGGLALYRGIPVTVLGHQKGRSLDENIRYRFGMPNPDGYRKAERLMLQAAKFGRPLITFVDTPGAYPGKEAEELGQGSAIASCLKTMSRLPIPIVSVFIGEGGSGGALAISICDRMIMLENAVYSILSPEGFASILWKDGTRWKEACEVMKMTAEELKEMKVCDRTIPETEAGAHAAREYIFAAVDRALGEELDALRGKKRSALAEERYRKLRNVGRQYARRSE